MGHARPLGLAYVSLHTPVLVESELGKPRHMRMRIKSNLLYACTLCITIGHIGQF